MCDNEGTEWFVLMECDDSMRSYEAIFGDMYGHKLVCVRRKMMRQVWNDGFYICTYKPNFPNQPPLYERDCNNSTSLCVYCNVLLASTCAFLTSLLLLLLCATEKIYPFSYLEVNQQKGKFAYKFYEYEDGEMKLEERPKLIAQNGWLGFMTIWCTPMTRCGKWTTEFRRPNTRETKILVDQWKNLVEVGPGQDVLAGLCMAYIFDVCQRQPFVTMLGKQDPEYDVPDDGSLGSDDEDWDGTPKREKTPLTGNEDEMTDNPEEFDDEGLAPPSTGDDGEDGEEPPPKKKKKKKKKKPQGKYPPAEPDEEAFADCLE